MRAGSFWMVGGCLLIVLGLAGCLDNGDWRYSGEPEMEDPHAFDGRLTRGDFESKNEQITEALAEWSRTHIALHELNGVASYEVTVDGEEACKAAREKVGELEFIRSRSRCVPAEV